MMRPTFIANARLVDPASDKVEDGAILFAETILDVGAEFFQHAGELVPILLGHGTERQA